MSFGDSDKAIFGAGSDLQIYHDGADSYVSDVGTGILRLNSNGTKILMETAGGETLAEFINNGNVVLYSNDEERLRTNGTGIDVTGNATFADNGKAIFGAGSDLEIYHQSSNNNSIIKESGAGILSLQSNGSEVSIYDSANGNHMGRFITGAEVQLQHNGDTKFSTTPTGVNVTGTAVMDGLTVDGDVAIASDLPSITLTDNNNSSSRADIKYNFGYLAIDADANGVDAAEAIDLKIGGATHFRLATGGDISFYEDTGTTAKFFWDSSAESLGIGTSSPATGLDVTTTNYTYGGTTYDIYGIIGLTNGGVRLGGDSTNSDSVIGTTGTGDMQFVTYNGSAWASRMTLDNTGQVGIGDTNPTNGYLTIRGASTSGTANSHIMLTGDGATVGEGPQIAFSESGGSSNWVGASIGFERTGGGGIGNLIFSTRGSTGDANTVATERMRIDSSGKVGIGTSSPLSKLHIENTSSNDGIRIINSTSGEGFVIFGDTADSNTGSIAYNHSSDAMTFDVNNSERMRIDSSGRVGIGTSSPNRVLDIATTTGGTIIHLTDDSTGHTATDGVDLQQEGTLFQILNREAGDIRFGTNNTERMRIDSSGNVGIGTNSVGGTTTSRQVTISGSAASQLTLAGGGSFYTNVGTNGTLGYLEVTGAKDLALYTNGSEAMRIDSSGRVGIGTSSQTNLLHLKDEGYQLKLEDTSSGNTGEVLVSDTSLYFFSDRSNAKANSDIRFSVDNSERMRIDASGNVGIGTSSPSRSLHVYEANASGLATFQNDGGEALVRLQSANNSQGILEFGDPQDGNRGRVVYNHSSNYLALWSNDEERMRITSSGTVGIGISAPTRTFHVNNATGLGGMKVQSGGTSDTFLEMETSTNRAYIGIDESLNVLKINNTGTLGSAVHMSIDASGKVGIGTSSPARPLSLTDATNDGTGGMIIASYLPTFELDDISGGGTSFILQHDGTSTIFKHDTTERMRLDSSGRLLSGSSSSRTVQGFHHKVQVEGTNASTASISIVRNTNSVDPPYITFGKTRSGSVGASGIVQQDDVLGRIDFTGANGSNLNELGARIDARVDGTPGGSDMPTRLTFQTSSDGSANPIERMRIDSAGRVTTPYQPSFSAGGSTQQTGSNNGSDVIIAYPTVE